MELQSTWAKPACLDAHRHRPVGSRAGLSAFTNGCEGHPFAWPHVARSTSVAELLAPFGLELGRI